MSESKEVKRLERSLEDRWLLEQPEFGSAADAAASVDETPPSEEEPE